MAFAIKIRGIEEATGEVQRAIGAGMLNGLEKTGARGARLVMENIISPFQGVPAAVATGNLADAIDFEIHDRTAVIFARPPADVYAAPVETGTRPHFPPSSALLLWVKQKFGADEKRAKSIAFLVARKISKKGTRGHFMFQRALEQLRTEVLGIFQREIGEELEAEGLGKK